MHKSSDIPSSKTKVLVLAGFLGAGKTTLLKRILSWETDLSDTVVIVNEFGAVGIDGSLLADAGSDVVELTSGCVCCSLQADLNQTLKKIQKQFNPKRIFIEATGVADPLAIRKFFRMWNCRLAWQCRKLSRSWTLISGRCVSALERCFFVSFETQT
jgi:G3E family GTPase